MRSYAFSLHLKGAWSLMYISSVSSEDFVVESIPNDTSFSLLVIWFEIRATGFTPTYRLFASRLLMPLLSYLGRLSSLQDDRSRLRLRFFFRYRGIFQQSRFATVGLLPY